MMAAKGAIKPVSELMKEQGEPFDPKSYLPAITGYYSTAKGDMLSFPFNSSSMVMWVNLDALKKAGIDAPPKTWPEVFADAKKLHATSPTCGFSSSWVTWGFIEQFSAWHNQPIGTKANGLDGFDTVLVFNTPLETKLLENLAELQKDKSYERQGQRQVQLYCGTDALLPRRDGCTAELHHRRRFVVGDGRQEQGRVQGYRQVLHLPLGHRPPGISARGLRLSADHQGGV
jgi:maltose-binding protein MalE